MQDSLIKLIISKCPNIVLINYCHSYYIYYMRLAKMPINPFLIDLLGKTSLKIDKY